MIKQALRQKRFPPRQKPLGIPPLSQPFCAFRSSAEPQQETGIQEKAGLIFRSSPTSAVSKPEGRPQATLADSLRNTTTKRPQATRAGFRPQCARGAFCQLQFQSKRQQIT